MIKESEKKTITSTEFRQAIMRYLLKNNPTPFSKTIFKGKVAMQRREMIFFKHRGGYRKSKRISSNVIPICDMSICLFLKRQSEGCILLVLFSTAFLPCRTKNHCVNFFNATI